MWHPYPGDSRRRRPSAAYSHAAHTKPRDRQDPDHTRANGAAKATYYTITAVQGLASAVPPANEESSGVVLAEEAGLLLDTEKGRLTRKDARQAPSAAHG